MNESLFERLDAVVETYSDAFRQLKLFNVVAFVFIEYDQGVVLPHEK